MKIKEVDWPKGYTELLRMYSCLCGFALLGIGIFGVVDAVNYIKYAKNDCVDTRNFSCHQAIELASGMLAMTFFIFIAALLIVATEFHVKGCFAFLPRYFGFLCTPLGRGLFHIFNGLLMIVLSKVYQGGVGTHSHVGPLVVGFLGIAAGVMYVLSSCRSVPGGYTVEPCAIYPMVLWPAHSWRFSPTENQSGNG